MCGKINISINILLLHNMNNPIDSFKNYWNLSDDIWKFNDIQSQLKEWWEILKSVKDKVWVDDELYKKFEKEYKDLYDSIKKSFTNEKNFSKEKRAQIMLELSDIVSLAESNWIIEKKWVASKIWDFIKWTDTNTQKEKAISFRDKKVGEYSKEEAIAAINYLSNNYWKYSNKSAKVSVFHSTINELDDQHEVRLFQDELIKKVFWEKNKFNSDYLVWFNNEKWNFVTKISDFEDYLKSPNTKILWDDKDSNVVNSSMLWNYFLYLSSVWKDNIGFVKTILNYQKRSDLKNSLENNPNSIVKKILSQNNLIDDFSFFYDDFNTKIDEKNYKDYLLLNPKNVFLVQDKNLLLKIIQNIENIKYVNIDFDLRHDIDIIEAISKKDKEFNISKIPQSFYQINPKNKADIEKIKKLLNISKNWDFLRVIWEISIFLDENQLKELLKWLGKNDYTKVALWYIDKLEKTPKEDFEKSIKDIKDFKNLTWSQIADINLYFFKYWINPEMEDILFKVLKIEKNNLDSFQWVQKQLEWNPDLIIKLIYNDVDIYPKLSTKSKENNSIVEAYLDYKINRVPYNYSNIARAIYEIEFWDDIWNILIIYDKLTKLWDGNVKRFFWNTTISHKFQLFLSKHKWSDKVKSQLEALNWINDIFKELEEDYKKAWDDLLKISENYNIEIKEEKLKTQDEKNDFDKKYLVKIKEITWLGDYENNFILKLIKNEKNDSINSNGRELLILLKKSGNWSDNKVSEKFKKLQDIKIEMIKVEVDDDKKSLEKSWLPKESLDNISNDIKNISKKYPKDKKETKEQYQDRIFKLLIEEWKLTLNEEQKLLVLQIIENQLIIEEVIFNQENISYYINYLEKWDFTTDFKQHVEEQKIIEQWLIINNNQDIKHTKSSNWNYLVNTAYWNIELSSNEMILVSNNKEAYKNLENFQKTLNELWLEKLWKYRLDIFKSISNKYVFEFNSKDDFINKNELKIFLNAILSSLWYEIYPKLTLEEIKLQVQLINNYWLIWWEKEVDNLWNSSIEKSFLNKFDTKRGWILEINKFQDSLWNLFSKTVS